MPAAFAGLGLDRPRLVGVVNVTPDSFSDGGRFLDPAAAVDQGRRLVGEGADMLDIGGESTRPGAAETQAEEQIRRVLPVIEGLADCGAPLSIDTRSAVVMKATVAAGASVVNDISALAYDPGALDTVAALGCPVILMHMRGDPATMREKPHYDDVVGEVTAELADRIAACEGAGVLRSNICVDPGLGFAKASAHNEAVLRGLADFHTLGCPVMIGASRKGLVRDVKRSAAPGERLAASLAAALIAAEAGVQFLRVHDVAETAQALAVWRAVRG
ncbi:MAG: dihydropteroate synthase [Rhodospirillaceae bacterium]|nr:dihydropteroate synthase [Rhodospirillaceae bacterium]MBT6117158.1 dihydropteroate synthase [Rhodospirillaceae bacterium]